MWTKEEVSVTGSLCLNNKLNSGLIHKHTENKGEESHTGDGEFSVEFGGCNVLLCHVTRDRFRSHQCMGGWPELSTSL